MSHPRCLPLRGQGRFAGPGNALPVFLKKGPDRAQKVHRPGPTAPNKNCGVPRIFRRPTSPRPAAPPAAGAGKGNRVSVPPPGARLQERVPCGRGGLKGPRSRRKRPGRGLSPLLPMQRDHPHRRGRPAAQGGGKRAAGFWNPAGFTPRGRRKPDAEHWDPAGFTPRGRREVDAELWGPGVSHAARATEAGRRVLGPGGLHAARATEAGRQVLESSGVHAARAAEAGRRSRAHFHEATPRPHPFRRFSAAGPLGRPGTAVFKPSGKGVGTVLKEKGRSRTKPNGARPTPPRPQGAARQGCGRGVSPRRAVGEGRGASGPHFFIAERQRQGGAFK